MSFFSIVSHRGSKQKKTIHSVFNFNFLLQASCQREFVGTPCERKGKLRLHAFPNENSVNVSCKPSTAHVFVPFPFVLVQKLSTVFLAVTKVYQDNVFIVFPLPPKWSLQLGQQLLRLPDMKEQWETLKIRKTV